MVPSCEAPFGDIVGPQSYQMLMMQTEYAGPIYCWSAAAVNLEQWLAWEVESTLDGGQGVEQDLMPYVG